MSKLREEASKALGLLVSCRLNLTKLAHKDEELSPTILKLVESLTVATADLKAAIQAASDRQANAGSKGGKVKSEAKRLAAIKRHADRKARLSAEVNRDDE